MKDLTDEELLDQLEDLNWCLRYVWSELHNRPMLIPQAWNRLRGYVQKPAPRDEVEVDLEEFILSQELLDGLDELSLDL